MPRLHSIQAFDTAPKLFLLHHQALLPGVGRLLTGSTWTETPCAFCLEFITKLNRICDIPSNLNFPVVTSRAKASVELFIRGRVGTSGWEWEVLVLGTVLPL